MRVHVVVLLSIVGLAAVLIAGCGGGGGAPALTVDQAEQRIAAGFDTLGNITADTSTDPATDATTALSDFGAALGTLPTDPEANLGWSLARAMTLFFQVSALFPATDDRAAGLMADPRQILRDLAGSFKKSNAALGRAIVPPIPKLLGRQARSSATPEQVRAYVVTDVLPALAQIIEHIDLALAAPDIDVTLEVMINGVTTDYQLDQGDAYLLKGALLVSDAVIEAATAYSLEFGLWNWEQLPTDADSSGDFTPDEYLPPSPFLALARANAFANAMAAMLQAADAVIAGADTSLHPGGATDLVNWEENPDVAAGLNEAADIAEEVKTAFASSAYPLTVDTTVVNVNLSAWATAPPPDLKALFPTAEVDQGAGTLTIASWPDLTFAGLFPDGVPPDLVQSIVLPLP